MADVDLIAYVNTAAGGSTLISPLPMLEHCPLAKNDLVHGRDISTWATGGGTITSTQDQVGIDGVPNTASLVTDASASSVYRYKVVGITGNTDWHTVKARIAKNTESGIFPFIGLDLTGASHYIQLNTATGAVTQESGHTAGEYASAVLVGDFWEVALSIQNTGAATLLYIYLSPARTATFGSASEAAAQASNIFDGVELFKNKRLYDVRGLPPILTTGTAVTVAADVNSLHIDNFPTAEGAIYFVWSPSYATAEVGVDEEMLSPSTVVGLAYYDGAAGNVESTDGTNTAVNAETIVADTEYKIGIIYSTEDSEMQVYVDGVGGTVVTFDGAHALGSVLALFRSATFPARMRGLQVWDGVGMAVLRAKIVELMA